MNRQLVINNLLIRYTVRHEHPGLPESGCLIFLHGWRSSAAAWTGILALAGERLPAYALDLPGFGGSQAPQEPFSLDDYCGVVAGFIEALGLRQVVLVGHSFGGRIAIKLSATRPELVRKLVLVDSAGFPASAARKAVLKAAAALARPLFKPGFMQPLRKKIYRHLGSEDYLATPELQRTFVRITEEDLSGSLKEIRQPTLIVWGEHDTDTPRAFAEKMNRGIAGSALVVLPRAGHFSFVDQPGLFWEALEKFIR